MHTLTHPLPLTNERILSLALKRTFDTYLSYTFPPKAKSCGNMWNSVWESERKLLRAEQCLLELLRPNSITNVFGGAWSWKLSSYPRSAKYGRQKIQYRYGYQINSLITTVLSVILFIRRPLTWKVYWLFFRDLILVAPVDWLHQMLSVSKD